jgi:catechol 2,3-dioxygenase-like lactoylglutathione lyase family enzyme
MTDSVSSMSGTSILGASLLGASLPTSFIATRDPKRAGNFYGGTLGLRLISEDGFAMVFESGGASIRVVTVREIALAPYTVLGWHVPDIMTVANQLRAAGVIFERFPGMDQDKDDIWTAPGGAKVAWFKDPDGNLLSISQS